MTEDEWRSGVRADGTRIVQDGAEPAKRPWSTPTIASKPMPHDAKATGAFIEGVHVDAETVNTDASRLGTMIVRTQAEVAAIGAESLRIANAALQQVDALKRLATYDAKEAEVRSKAANYDDIAELIKIELVKKRGWAPTGAKDAFFNLFNDNVRLTAELEHARRNSNTLLEDYKAMDNKHRATIANLEDDLRALRKRLASP